MRVVILFLLVTLLPLLPFLLWLGWRRGRASRTDVADTLEAFLDGSGARRDWTRFLATPLSDPALEAIRLRCSHLPEEFPPRRAEEYCSDAGRQVLRDTVGQLRQSTPPDARGGQPQ